MVQTICYGKDTTIEFDLPDHVEVVDCTSPQATPIDDPAAAIAAAVENPIDFPSLDQATIAGDTIAIVLEPGLPRISELVAGIVHSLSTHNIEPVNIAIVYKQIDSNHESGEIKEILAQLPEEAKDQIQVVVHDPQVSGSMAYVAATGDGDPIYVNRAISDADVIIPVGVFRLSPDLQSASVHQSFFRNYASTLRDAAQPPQNITDEAAWLLGIQFTIQVIPGPGNEVLNIIAGDAASVREQGRALCENAWRFDVPQRASLVVATIQGGRSQQTWDNFSRALTVAQQAVADDGAIVICCDIDEVPAMSQSDDDDSIADSPFDIQLSTAQENARVFLLSGLNCDWVEDQGIGYVRSTDEVARLGQQHDSCTLVANAQHAVVIAQES